MKLADLATGSNVIVWIVFVIFAVLSIILLFGHGLDIIQLQKKKRKNTMKRSYVGQWDLECLLSQFLH